MSFWSDQQGAGSSPPWLQDPHNSFTFNRFHVNSVAFAWPEIAFFEAPRSTTSLCGTTPRSTIQPWDIARLTKSRGESRNANVVFYGFSPIFSSVMSKDVDNRRWLIIESHGKAQAASRAKVQSRRNDGLSRDRAAAVSIRDEGDLRTLPSSSGIALLLAQGIHGIHLAGMARRYETR